MTSCPKLIRGRIQKTFESHIAIKGALAAHFPVHRVLEGGTGKEISELS